MTPSEPRDPADHQTTAQTADERARAANKAADDAAHAANRARDQAARLANAAADQIARTANQTLDERAGRGHEVPSKSQPRAQAIASALFLDLRSTVWRASV